MIRIHRSIAWADKLRAYKVLVDGELIGEIRQGETQEFPVTGRHTLQLKLDWCASPLLDFDAGTGTAEFECAANLKGFKLLFPLYYVIFDRKGYIKLEQRQAVAV